MSKPLPGDTSLADLIWVPGEGSSTGNVTGGRKFARHYFVACHTSERGAPSTTARFASSSWLRCWNSGPSTRTANTTVAEFHSSMALALSHLCAPCSTDVTGREN